MSLIKNHFDDCPYGCNDKGKILDDNLGRLVDCPHCSKIKKELIRGGMVETVDDERLSLSKVLGIESEFLSTKYVYETVIPDGELLFIDDESIKKQQEISTEMYLGLTVGNLPETSICYGISIKGRAERFAYPMLAKAYMSGLSVCKFISCSEFNRLCLDAKNDLSEFYTSDLLMMLINEGSTLADISSAKGIMQSRALKGKPTIFITTWTIEACSALLGYYDNDSYSLATPVFVEYKSAKKKGHSNYINKLLGVENDNIQVEDSVPQNIEVSKSQTRGMSMSDLLG